MWKATNLLILLMLSASPGVARCEVLGSDDWPQFRGTNASGVATGDAPPVSWDISASQNIAWKTEIPGLGFASPIVCRGQVIIVTAVGENDDPQLRTGLYGNIKSVDDEGPHSWQVYSLALRTGEVRWKRILHAGPPTMKRHTKASHANATPATDGKRVIVNLASEGLYCLDLAGNLCWKKDLGPLDSGYYVAPDAQWGYASSPIIFQDMVIVLADVQEGSFLAAYDVRSGRQRWKTDRQDVPTWGTPTIVTGPIATELIVNGYRQSCGYDPRTGQELWTLSGGGDIPVPTPVAGHGFVYLSSSHGGNKPLRAIRPGARGNITLKKADAVSENIVWARPKDGIYLQTPIVYGAHLYACRNNGVLSCYDAYTGERHYRKRIGGGSFTASPVAASGRLYFTSEKGEVYVVQAGEEYNLLAKNQMDDICLATPAISKGILVVRTKDHVYGLKEKPDNDRNYIIDTIVSPSDE